MIVGEKFYTILKSEFKSNSFSQIKTKLFHLYTVNYYYLLSIRDFQLIISNYKFNLRLIMLIFLIKLVLNLTLSHEIY